MWKNANLNIRENKLNIRTPPEHMTSLNNPAAIDGDQMPSIIMTYGPVFSIKAEYGARG